MHVHGVLFSSSSWEFISRADRRGLIGGLNISVTGRSSFGLSRIRLPFIILHVALYVLLWFILVSLNVPQRGFYLLYLNCQGPWYIATSTPLSCIKRVYCLDVLQQKRVNCLVNLKRTPFANLKKFIHAVGPEKSINSKP